MRLLPNVGPALLVALFCASLVRAHDAGYSHENGTMQDGMLEKDPAEYPPTYFAHPEHAAIIYSHIALMVLAWVFVLPVAVMFSISNSRYTLPLQLAFFAVNAVGIILATIYNANTPDLYPNNAHHKIGWIITWVFLAQLLVSLTRHFGGARKRQNRQYAGEHLPFLAIHVYSGGEPQNAAEDRHEEHFTSATRSSGASSHEASSTSESQRSSSTMCGDYTDCDHSDHKDYDVGDEIEPTQLAPRRAIYFGLASKAVKLVPRKIWKHTISAYKVVDRIILPFGSIALGTGILTFGRFFEGNAVFSGLAHWIKGGVFFWLGLFTLGRWCGSFADLGWAWNVRPKDNLRQKKKFRPSAEFIESALIFFYGSTNIFLEHLGGWGGDWTSQDLEHLAITVLFLGGGLCGMLIESTSVRDLLNFGITSEPVQSFSEEEQGYREPPASYEFSVNPIPALVILLLGIMMSSHQQASMISSMVHKQWGNLLLGASFTRALSYALVYLRPPQSMLPSRPPTELLASFGLIAGGIIFMASSSDTVSGMIHYELDAMFMYTITMGLVGLLMAWEIAVLALKGWAMRIERSPRL